MSDFLVKRDDLRECRIAESEVPALEPGQALLAVDSFVGQDEVMIKPLEGIKPKGVTGATLSGEGVVVLVLEMHEMLQGRV